MNKALQTMINNMPEKTDKSLDQWKEILRQQNYTKYSEAMNYLKGEHGVTHGFVNTIIALSIEVKTSDDDLVSNLYQSKENLKSICNELLKRIKKFGEDVIITPKKTSVSCIRKNNLL